MTWFLALGASWRTWPMPNGEKQDGADPGRGARPGNDRAQRWAKLHKTPAIGCAGCPLGPGRDRHPTGPVQGAASTSQDPEATTSPLLPPSFSTDPDTRDGVFCLLACFT